MAKPIESELWVSLRTNTGPGCSKLTTSLDNAWFKFQTLISEIPQYVLLTKKVKSFCSSAKAFLIFSTKNISVPGYKEGRKTLTKFDLLS